MTLKNLKTFEVLEYDQHGDGTRVWHARWNGADEITIYVGTVSEDEILVKRLQKIKVIKGKKNMRVNEFHQTVSEFLESMLEAEKVTGRQWNG